MGKNPEACDCDVVRDTVPDAVNHVGGDIGVDFGSDLSTGKGVDLNALEAPKDNSLAQKQEEAVDSEPRRLAKTGIGSRILAGLSIVPNTLAPGISSGAQVEGMDVRNIGNEVPAIYTEAPATSAMTPEEYIQEKYPEFTIVDEPETTEPTPLQTAGEVADGIVAEQEGAAVQIEQDTAEPQIEQESTNEENDT